MSSKRSTERRGRSALILPLYTLLIALFITPVACQDGATSTDDQPASSATMGGGVSGDLAKTSPPTPQAEIGRWGIDQTAMEPKTKPGGDFGRYVNGAWLDRFKIPADKARYGIFTALYDRSVEQVNAIIKELSSKENAEGTPEQKVGDTFATWMDLKAINAAGITPIKAHLKAISKIKRSQDLMRAFADLKHNAPFGISIIPDPADTTRYALVMGQGGLGMPDRDYYLKKEDRFKQFRAAYLSYIKTLLTLADIKGAKKKAKAILKLETQLAKIHWTKAESRDIKKINNPMSIKALKKSAPQVDWSLILKTLKLDGIDNIVVFQPSAISASAKIIKKTSIKTWRNYLSFHLLSQHASYLSAPFDRASFEFFSKTLRGIESQKERWKRGTELINRNLGEVVGKIYLKRHFPEESKKQMDQLVRNVKMALEERLNKNDWMDGKTRAQALKKLATFEPRIGYPSKWIDYSTLKVVRGDLLGNMIRVTKFKWDLKLKRLRAGKVDRELWPYPPQTVNASYNPLLNQLTFPAGILQPPFFDPKADPAVNYGAIGAVIGHEMGHGFDDQGRRFDETGVIRDWWTETADQNFKKRSGRLVTQYNAYSPLEGMHINGELTLGENIGDLGGMEMAYAAYQKHLKETGGAPVLDGFTGDQRFFMSWAQVWRGKMREDALRERLVTDPHSPAKYRINGVVRNIDAWYLAFDVKAGDALYLAPEERVKIW